MRPDFPGPRTDLSKGNSFGYAQCSEAVEDGCTDLDLSDLAIEVAGHHALTNQFDAVHLRLDAAPAVVSAPLSPERPSKVF